MIIITTNFSKLNTTVCGFLSCWSSKSINDYYKLNNGKSKVNNTTTGYFSTKMMDVFWSCLWYKFSWKSSRDLKKQQMTTK